MKEYIERTALIRYAEKQEVIIKDGTSIADAMRIQGNVFRRCVETCPTADVVEVVRCGECRHWKKDVPGCTDFARRCELGGYMIGATGFCLYGERR